MGGAHGLTYAQQKEKKTKKVTFRKVLVAEIKLKATTPFRVFGEDGAGTQLPFWAWTVFL